RRGGGDVLDAQVRDRAPGAAEDGTHGGGSITQRAIVGAARSRLARTPTLEDPSHAPPHPSRRLLPRMPARLAPRALARARAGRRRRQDRPRGAALRTLGASGQLKKMGAEMAIEEINS